VLAVTPSEANRKLRYNLFMISSAEGKIQSKMMNTPWSCSRGG
jgi:hypothetical protein